MLCSSLLLTNSSQGQDTVLAVQSIIMSHIMTSLPSPHTPVRATTSYKPFVVCTVYWPVVVCIMQLWGSGSRWPVCAALPVATPHEGSSVQSAVRVRVLLLLPPPHAHVPAVVAQLCERRLGLHASALHTFKP